MIKGHLLIVHGKKSFTIEKFNLSFKLSLKDRIYIHDFIDDNKETPDWLEPGSIAEIEEITIYKSFIIYTSVFKLFRYEI